MRLKDFLRSQVGKRRSEVFTGRATSPSSVKLQLKWRQMNIINERKLAARATELGNSVSPHVFDELVALALSPSALVRWLAASALGKLAGIVPAEPAVRILKPLLADAHPQVRQYAAKALGAFGTDAEAVLHDLRDMYKNPNNRGICGKTRFLFTRV